MTRGGKIHTPATEMRMKHDPLGWQDSSKAASSPRQAFGTWHGHAGEEELRSLQCFPFSLWDDEPNRLLHISPAFTFSVDCPVCCSSLDMGYALLPLRLASLLPVGPSQPLRVLQSSLTGRNMLMLLWLVMVAEGVGPPAGVSTSHH